MIYDKLMFLEPPRAETTVPPSLLDSYEAKGWFAQFKKNGTSSVIAIAPDKTLTAWTRHGVPHKAWSFSSGSRNFFQSLPGKGWYVICAELMHSKVPGIRDTHYIHDILVDDGDWLLGKTYAQRYDSMLRIFWPLADDRMTSNPEEGYFRLDDHTQMAMNFSTAFRQRFDKMLNEPQNEGLVLKNPAGKLAIKDNSSWTIKCRHPNKNLGF